MLTPHLVVNGGTKAAEFYKKALDAKEVMMMMAEDKARVMHCHLTLPTGGQFFLCDDFPEYCNGKKRAPSGASPVTLHVEAPNCDDAMAKFAAAGGTVTMPAQDMFWGDRYGQCVDPFGHTWSFSHHLAK